VEKRVLANNVEYIHKKADPASDGIPPEVKKISFLINILRN
jgi:hypothetical protein